MRNAPELEASHPAGGGTAVLADEVDGLLERLPVADANREVLAQTLGGCPELGELLGLLHSADRATARAVALLGRLHDRLDVEAVTGLPLGLWLSVAGRSTRSDRRMLMTAAETLARLPNLADAFGSGQLSWPQLRAVVLICARLPDHVCGHIDLEVSARLPGLERADPDEVVGLVRQAAASYSGDPADPGQPAALQPDDRFVHVQPRLDGTGGRVYAELDALGLAVFDRATDPGPPDPAQRSATPGRRRADRLIDTLAASLTTTTHDSDGEVVGRSQGGDGALLPVAPNLLVTATLDSLLGHDKTPAELLVSLAGARLKVSAALARRLVNEAGASVRLLVVDDTGAVVGIGRRHRQPPGWLTDATLTLDRTCAQPGCDRPAIHCDIDHIVDWDDGGPTDLPNLQRLCRHHNRTTRKAGWDITVNGDGTRTWTHHRTGITLRTIPATYRLPPARSHPPAGGGTDPPHAGGDPPEHDLPF